MISSISKREEMDNTPMCVQLSVLPDCNHSRLKFMESYLFHHMCESKKHNTSK